MVGESRSTSSRRLLNFVTARPALTVFIGTGVLMALFLAAAPESLRPKGGYNDYEIFYRPVAENLLDGRGYTNLEGEPALHNPPGYIFVLVALYKAASLLGVSQDLMVAAFAVAAMAGSAVLVFLLARRLFGPRTAWIAAALWSTYPINLLIASYRFSEVPYTFVLALAVLVFVSAFSAGRRLVLWSFGVGLLVGAAALIRPAAIGLAAPFALAILLIRAAGPLRARSAMALVLVAGFAVAIAPWELWAYQKTDRVIPLSEAGNASMLDGLTVGARPRDESGRGFLIPPAVRDLSHRIQSRRKSLTTTDDIAEELSDESPGTLAQLVLSKAARAWYGTNALKFEPLILLVQLIYLGLAGFGLVQAARRGGWPRWTAALVLAVTAYSWAITMTVLSIVRYMAPVLGLLLIFAAPPVAAAAARAARRFRPGATAGAPAP